MPQMSPINWLTLMIMFILTLMMFVNLNYFSFFYQPKNQIKKTSSKKINWKW